MASASRREAPAFQRPAVRPRRSRNLAVQRDVIAMSTPHPAARLLPPNRRSIIRIEDRAVTDGVASTSTLQGELFMGLAAPLASIDPPESQRKARPTDARSPSHPMLPPHALCYPEFRYMGSKHRLLPWIHEVVCELSFDTAADPFSGSGSVAYLLKAMGKEIHASDFLNFPSVIASAVVANPSTTLSSADIARVMSPAPTADDFIRRTFAGIFFTPDDLTFLDEAWHNLRRFRNRFRRDLALAALIRACMKRQPRGVFTVGNHADGSQRYDDGRRDVRLSLREHFAEQAAVINGLVFDNERTNDARRADAFAATGTLVPDLVYLDPPYVPRADDNCYVKRYHFLEGLSCYWEGVRILDHSKVRKIEKPYTPFSYRRDAVDAFERLFRRFADSTIVLSYSSNGFPDRATLTTLLRRVKRRVEIHERAHRYHFGTHRAVERAQTVEYLFVGLDS